MSIAFTPKQKTFIKKATRKLNIAVGSVRSGKTVSATVAFLLHVVRFTEPKQFAIFGKTRDTVRRNVIPLFKQYLGESSYEYLLTRDEMSLLGHRIYILGANDEKSETRIRGLTLHGALLDEITTYPRSVFEQILARNSGEGARVFGTTNPDSPYHWLYQDYVAVAERKGYYVEHFWLEDNPFLPADYIEFLQKTYSGLFYKRFVLGEWAAAEGVIYEMFDEARHVVDELPEGFDRYIVGVDFGMQNPTVFLLVGVKQGVYYVVKEYYHEGRQAGAKTVDKYAKELRSWLGGVSPSAIYVDPSAQALVEQLKAEGFRQVREAENEVLDGIATVSRLLNSDRLFVYRKCEKTIAQFYSYVWDKKAQERGEDRPLKQDDHLADGLRYAIFSDMTRAPKPVVSKPKGW